jgi:hypothetical protein
MELKTKRERHVSKLSWRPKQTSWTDYDTCTPFWRVSFPWAGWKWERSGSKALTMDAREDLS